MSESRSIRKSLERSIAFRWIMYVTSAVFLGISAMIMVTYREMEFQLEAESKSVMALARHKTAERIDGEIGLVQLRLTRMIEGLESALLSVASQRTVQSAVQSDNDVRIAEDVGKKLVKLGFNGAIILDEHLNVIGSERTGAELVSSNLAFSLHHMRDQLKDALTKSDIPAPIIYRFVGMLDPSYAAILLGRIQHDYGIVLATPVLNDFQEPVGVIIAFRTLRRSEPQITEFSSLTRTTVALMVGDRPISIAGASNDQINLMPAGREGLMEARDLAASARCGPSFPGLSICVMHPNSEIERFRDEIVSIGRTHLHRTQRVLLLIGGLAVALTMLVVAMLGRRLTRPIVEITQVVDRVARGEWRVEVGHTERLDEIGKIARAVAAMQVSLAERDRMRQEMIRIDAINQRRLVLDGAVSRFEDGMAVVMKDISDTVHVLSEANETLDTAARRADSQAEKIRDTSRMTADSASVVSKTTLELSRAIRDIGNRIRNTSGVVHLSEAHARDAEERLGEVAGVTTNVEEAISVLQETMADLGHLGLRASLDAVAAGESGGAYAPLARSIGLFAGKATGATQIILHEMTRLSEVTNGAVGAIGEAKEVLGGALRDTEEMSVAIEQQNATAREIVDSLSASASSLISLAEAVDHLRESMASAHGASVDFVLTARRMADDAKAIDNSLRLFMRDVVA